jgi:hypothetical protein
MKDFEDEAYKTKLMSTTVEFLNNLYNSVEQIPM